MISLIIVLESQLLDKDIKNTDEERFLDAERIYIYIADLESINQKRRKDI